MNITELCVNCKQNNACTMCWKTSNKKCPHFIQKTNEDRIRAMSDEELAETIGGYMHCAGCPLRGDCNPEELPCENVLLKWLKQPAEEGAEHG